MPRLRCLSIVMTTLLAPLVYSAATKAKMPPHCKDKEMACFVNEKCAGTGTDAFLSQYKLDNPCAVHVELRPYSTKKALIRLRAEKGPIKLLYEGSSGELFGCEKDGEVIRRTGPTDKRKELIHGEKWEGGIACEFLYESSEQDDLFDKSKELVIYYGNDKVTGYPDLFGKSQIPIKAATKCDIDWLINHTEDNATFFYSEPNKYFSEVLCPTGTLVFLEDEDTLTEAASITCKKKADKWQYTITSKESPETTVVANKDTPQKVACRSKACAQCESIPVCPSSSNCKAAQVVREKDGCKVLKCGDKKYPFIKINDTKTTIGQAVCTNHIVPSVEDDEDETKKTFEYTVDYRILPYRIFFRWKFEGNSIENAECVESAHCQDINPLQLEQNEASINLTKTTLQCAAGLISFEGGVPTTTIVCDGRTGSWKTMDGVVVPKGTKISCQAPPESTTETTAPNGANIGLLEYVAAAIGILILFIVIGIIIFCLVCKKRLDKQKNAKKIKTFTSSRLTKSEDNLKTAVPVGYAPPSSGSQKPSPEPLVEKTVIAATPDKQPSVVMKTAILDLADDDTTYAKDNVSKNIFGIERPMRKLKDVEKKEQSDGSDPRSIKIGKNGEILVRTKKNRSKGPKSEEKSEVKSQSDPGSTKKEEKSSKKEEKKEEKKKEEPPSGPMPQTFALNEKEEKIRKGATKKQAEYPTMEDIMSDWTDSEEVREYHEAYAAGPEALEGWKKKKAEKDRKKDRKKGRKNTVPTAVTPDQPHSVERTQATKTRNSVDKGEDANMENLLTQMDTTVEQKEADAKKK
ncbi:hypothetical protein PRIPAC_72524 [Pristionchus pacificus]|uniref:Uncharacterized protein n=1 Tax=Pristionchus pacificus TaxID=54126 RepID=A0A2A6CGD0_PRIPA|nr:hypothetical protein PRIPAC_72524 [Pristionchus pacificus]|eukprot:PDM77156.1 hypothetical protein PRIPAC_43068 [Pristionchus pacificus]